MKYIIVVFISHQHLVLGFGSNNQGSVIVGITMKATHSAVYNNMVVKV